MSLLVLVLSVVKKHLVDGGILKFPPLASGLPEKPANFSQRVAPNSALLQGHDHL